VPPEFAVEIMKYHKTRVAHLPPELRVERALIIGCDDLLYQESLYESTEAYK